MHRLRVQAHGIGTVERTICECVPKIVERTICECVPKIVDSRENYLRMCA